MLLGHPRYAGILAYLPPRIGGFFFYLKDLRNT